jgi:hypothetical protein
VGSSVVSHYYWLAYGAWSTNLGSFGKNDGRIGSVEGLGASRRVRSIAKRSAREAWLASGRNGRNGWGGVQAGRIRRGPQRPAGPGVIREQVPESRVVLRAWHSLALDGNIPRWSPTGELGSLSPKRRRIGTSVASSGGRFEFKATVATTVGDHVGTVVESAGNASVDRTGPNTW